MKLYAAEIRIGKNPVNHTVFRPTRKAKPATNERPALPDDHLTAAEIMILRHLHDTDSVVNIEVRGEQRRSHRYEKTRLLERYGKKPFEAVFGPVDGVTRLPEELGRDEDEGEGDEPVFVEPAPKPPVLSGGVAAAFSEKTDSELAQA
jgi:hypothetical protein